MEPEASEEDRVPSPGAAHVQNAHGGRARVCRGQPHEAMVRIPRGEPLHRLRTLPERKSVESDLAHGFLLGDPPCRRAEPRHQYDVETAVSPSRIRASGTT